MMFESKREPIIPFNEYVKRQLKYFIYSSGLVGISLAIGTLGYSYFEDLSLIDGFYNSSMILTGMGPVNTMTTTASKLFSSFYALFSGIAFLSTIAIFFAPVVHRFLHYLHLEDDGKN